MSQYKIVRFAFIYYYQKAQKHFLLYGAALYFLKTKPMIQTVVYFCTVIPK